MTQNGRKIKKITPRQRIALSHLTAAPSTSEAARQSGISARTIRRWLQDDDFRQELDHLREEAGELAAVQLQGLMLQSVIVIAEAMKDPSVSVRLHAARTALSYGVRLGQLEKFQQQLEAVEDALPLWARYYSKN